MPRHDSRNSVSSWVALCALFFGSGCVGEGEATHHGPSHTDGVITPGVSGTSVPGRGTSGSPVTPGTTKVDADMGGTIGGGATEQDMALPRAPFGELPPEEYARKVKFLVHGGVLSAKELDQVNADPAALKSLLTQWVETPEFRAKAFLFLRDSLQQEYRPSAANKNSAIVTQLRGSDSVGNFGAPDKMHQALESMFVHTAMKIVTDGRPFHEIATTSTWMMTPAIAMYLLAADESPQRGKDVDIHTFYGPKSGLPGFDATTPLSKQIDQMTWYVPLYEEGYRDRKDCTKTLIREDRASGLGELWSSGRCAEDGMADAIDPEDFDTWEEVTIRPLGQGKTRLRYYDLINIREAVWKDKVLDLAMPRVGFFTTPAYLAHWRTNVDNSFRVTTNQALIIGLNHSFEPQGFTVPLTQEGLGADHVEKNTECYGCHVALDPMRNYFARVFDADYYSVPKEKDTSKDKASFGFLGHQVDKGSDLATFGQAIATHPGFASGWAQKLCFFANSKACDPADPEFKRVEKAFVDSNFNFKTLVIALFSSPLITAQSRTKTHDASDYITSITRNMHLCHALTVRMGATGFKGYDACNAQNRMAVAIPEDAWSRGATEPFQPATSSLFYSATIETFCTIFSTQVVNKPDSPFDSRSAEGIKKSLDVVVSGLMGIPANDSRHDQVRALMQDHYDQGFAKTKDTTQSVRSAVTLGCMSPFLISPDF